MATGQSEIPVTTAGINPALKLIFIHNPHTAGTSISRALGLLDSHDTATAVRKRMGEEVWASCFKLAFVRDPMERFISGWKHRQCDDLISSWHPARRLRGVTLDQAASLCLSDRELLYSHCAPQTHYLSETLDFIGRFENLEADWQELCERAGIDIPLPRLNSSVADSTGPSAFLCAAVEKMYLSDFLTFDYPLPMPAAAEAAGNPLPSSPVPQRHAGPIQRVKGCCG